MRIAFMKKTVFILLLASVCEAKPAHYHVAILKQRDVNYRQAQAEMQRLVFVRGRIATLDSALKGLKTAWENLTPVCESAELKKIEDCQGRLVAFYQTISQKLSETLAFQSGQENLDFVANSPVQVRNLQQSLSAGISALEALSKKSQKLEESVSSRLATARLEAMQERLRAKRRTQKEENACLLQPPVVAKKIEVAKRSQYMGLQKNDGHLIMRAEFLAREVMTTSKAMAAACPDSNWSNFERQAREILKTHPSFEVIQSMMLAACKKVVTQDLEILRICKEVIINPLSLYSLHLELAKEGGRR